MKEKLFITTLLKKRTNCNINVIIEKCRIKQRKTTSFFGKDKKNAKVLQMQLSLFGLYNIIQVTKNKGEKGNENYKKRWNNSRL